MAFPRSEAVSNLGLSGAKAWVLSLENPHESGCNAVTCFGVIQMWGLQPTSRGTSRVLISLTYEMGTAMPVSKDPGGDATALWAMKNLRKLYIPCPHTCTDDSMLLFPEGRRDGEGGWQGGWRINPYRWQGGSAPGYSWAFLDA